MKRYSNKTSALLINEPPLQVLPSLAMIVGINEAIFLQQVQYWLFTTKHHYEGRPWVFNTQETWMEQMPFFPRRSLQRVINNLRESGVLLTTKKFNRVYNGSQTDQTMWYSIDYERLNELYARLCQVGTIESANLAQWKVPYWHNLDCANMAQSYIEQETTQETTLQERASAQPTQGTPPTASPAPPPDPYADTPREQPPPAKPSRAKQAKAPALAEHPAVAIYRELCERYPSKLQMKLIAEADPPLDNWVRAIRTWGGRGHNITNIEGILDWAINPKLMQRKSGKHKSNSISQPDQGQAAADEAEIQAAIEWAKIHYPDKFIHDNQAAARDPSGGG